MKKLIAFSVIFALLAGAVFAAEIGSFDLEATINATLFEMTSFEPFSSTAIGGDRSFGKIEFKWNYETSDGSAGVEGLLITTDGHSLVDGSKDMYALAYGGSVKGWWKPVEDLKITLGGAPTFARYQSKTDDDFDFATIWSKTISPFMWLFKGNSSNWIGVEVSNISDMVTLNLGLLKTGNNADLEEAYTPFVAQAIIDLAENGIAGLTFNNADEVFHIDYRNEFDGFNLFAAAGFAFDGSWGFGFEAGLDLVTFFFDTDSFEEVRVRANIVLAGIDPWVTFHTLDQFDTFKFKAGAGYEISGISLSGWVGFDQEFDLSLELIAKYTLVSFSDIKLEAGLTVDSFSAFADTLGLYVKASTEFTEEFDFFNATFKPSITIDILSEFAFTWAFDIDLKKEIEGFTFESGIKIGGDIGGTSDNFLNTLKIPVMFKYKW